MNMCVVQCSKKERMALFRRRQSSLGPNVATHTYQDGQPLHIVRGEGCHLYNEEGEEFLDCVNNVAHVGHAHPKVPAWASCTAALTDCALRHGILVQRSSKRII